MRTPPKGSVTPLRLNIGTVSADVPGMTTNTAPKVTRPQAANLLTQPTAVVVLNLTTGRTRLENAPTDALWNDPTLLVLATHADASHAAAQSVGAADFLGKLTRTLNAELADLAARGEIPTAEEVVDVLAELAQYETERDAEVIAFPGGAA